MNWRRECAYVGLIGAAVFAFFGRIFTTGGAFFVQDIMVQNYPFRDFFARHIRAGILPLWDPSVNCGFPLFAEGQAGPLYPFNWLTSLLPTHWGLSLNILLHLWLAGAGMYALLRLWCARPEAALTGGLAYALSGYMVVRAMSPNFINACAWLPVLLLFVALYVERGRFRYLVLASGIVALQMLVGHPQAAVYGILLCVGYGYYMGIVRRRGLLYFVVLSLVPVGGAILSAAQWLPTAELTELSIRSKGVSWRQFVNMSLPPERLFELLLPNLHGNSAHGTYWGRSAGFFIQLCPFVGVLTLVLAWVALRERVSEPVGFLALIACVGLVLSVGKYTGVFELLYQIPGLRSFRIPTRFLLFFALGISALAGLGCHAVLSEKRPLAGRGFTLTLALLGVFALVVNAKTVLASGATLENLGGDRLLRYAEILRLDALRLMVVLLAAFALLSGWIQRWKAAVIPGIVLIELYSFGADFNGLIRPSSYTEVPPTAQVILDGHTGRAPPRVMSLVSEQNAPFDWHGGWAYDQDSYHRYTETLRPYSGGLYGLGNVLPGWSPLHLTRQWDLARLYPRFARLASVDYVISYGPLVKPGLRRVYDGEIQVYALENSAPRAFLVTDYVVIGNDRERLRYLRQSASDWSRVVLEEAPGIEKRPGDKAGDAEIVSYGNEEVLVKVGDHSGGLLVLNDAHYPGWRAYVDGEERPILQANHAFRAVVIQPGAREVRFSFESKSVRWGGWISAIGWLCWVLTLAGLWSKQGWQFSPVGEHERTGHTVAIACAQGALVVFLYGACVRWPLWSGALERMQVLMNWGG